MDDVNKPVLVIRTIQAPILIKTLDVVKELVSDCNFIFSPSGVVVSVMDAAHQSYVYVNLPAEMFDFYACDGVHSLGVNNSHFHKLIRQATNRDEMGLEYHPSRPELVISVRNITKKTCVTSRMKLLDIDSELLEVPIDRAFSTLIEMNAAEFLKMCRELQSVGGDEVCISSDPREETVVFQVEGDIGTVQHALTNSSNQTVRAGVENAKAIQEYFAVCRLVTMAKMSSLSSQVQIYLEEAFPILLKYTIAEKGVVAFCLSPQLNRHRPLVVNA